MKKVILAVLGMLTLVGVCYAAPKRVPREYGTADQIITSSPAIIEDVTLYYVGVTVGDNIVLRNGTSTSAPRIQTLVASTANGSFVWNPEPDVTVDGGIYLDITRTGGLFGISIMYQ